MNLADLSLPELQKLSTKVARELAKREAAGKAGLLKRMRALARAQGLSLAEVLGTKPAPHAEAPAKRKQRLPAKYMHPSNRSLAWSGRGRRPAWVDAWVAQGGALDALQTAATKLTK